MAQQVVKRYRLKKDLPTAKAGTIYYNDHGSYYSARIKGIQVEHDWVVEHAPDWFEEVKDEPKPKVTKVGVCKGIGDMYFFNTKFKIEEKQYSAIATAIEGILSAVNYTPKKSFEDMRTEIENSFVDSLINGSHYSYDEIDQLQREAFEAGRQDHPYKSTYEYSDYEDYKNRKK